MFMIMLLICSASMSVLALFYMAITPILEKHYSPRGCYYAWLIIIIGLLIPFRPHFNNAIVKIDMSSKMATPVFKLGNETNIFMPATVTSTSTLPNVSVWQIIFTIWLAGMVIFLTYHIVKHYRFFKLVARWSEDVTDENTLILFQELRTKMNISKRIDLKLCTSIGSPMMIGFFDTRILLPRSGFAQDELRFILQHELIHYKRKDIWYKLLVLITTAIHWFNPIVYLIAKAINMQCELSCDDKIVYSTDLETRQQYSETIIGIIKYKTKIKTAALTTNFYGGKSGMKKRILSIMDTSKKKAGLAIIFALLIVTLGTSFVFAASTSGNTIQANKKTTSRTESLIQNFAKYKSFGVTYDSQKDAVYYNRERVKLFVDFSTNKEEDMKYAFDLCYQDKNIDSTLYLEAVTDKNGNITEIRRLNKQIAFEILGVKEKSTNNADKIEKESSNKGDAFVVVMDAKQVIEKYNITAQDLTKDKLDKNIKSWIERCDKMQGAYILNAKTVNGYTTYIYYNGGGRYPWNMSADDDKISVNLYSNSELSTTDGYYLMYFTAPKEYKNISLYLDSTALTYEVSN